MFEFLAHSYTMGAISFIATLAAVLLAHIGPEKSEDVICTTTGQRFLRHQHETLGLLWIFSSVFGKLLLLLGSIGLVTFAAASYLLDIHGNGVRWLLAGQLDAIACIVLSFIYGWFNKMLYGTFGDTSEPFTDRTQRLGHTQGRLAMLAVVSFFAALMFRFAEIL